MIGYEGGALRGGISALIKEAWESSFLLWEDTVKSQQSAIQKKGLHKNPKMLEPDLGLPVTRNY